jgi:hypothetical protein
MVLYAALGVREVWRCDGERLAVHLLADDGADQQQPQSEALPGLDLREIEATLEQRNDVDETTLVRSFRERIRGQTQ